LAGQDRTFLTREGSTKSTPPTQMKTQPHPKENSPLGEPEQCRFGGIQGGRESTRESSSCGGCPVLFNSCTLHIIITCIHLLFSYFPSAVRAWSHFRHIFAVVEVGTSLRFFGVRHTIVQGFNFAYFSRFDTACPTTAPAIVQRVLKLDLS
jgi:hypothetical protein